MSSPRVFVLSRLALSSLALGLVFFISDGFVVDARKSNAPDLLRRVTDEAARVGAVVYTMDPRGVLNDPAVSAGRNDYADFSQRVAGRGFFDAKTMQEPLLTLAAETGGRAFINTNSLNDAFAEAAREASRYYLLAWRPDTEAQRSGKSRVEVVVRGRPDLRVQARRRFVAAKAPAAPEGAGAKPEGADAPRTPDGELRDALASLYPRRDLPLALSVGFLNEQQKGLVLVASMQLDGEALGFGADEQATLDVQGVALDDRGSFYSFKQVLAVSRAKLREGNQRLLTWNQRLALAPGLYQVRVAARDRLTGRARGRSEWIEIPGPAPSGLSMSSIFLGELRGGEDFARRSVAVNVGRRFERHSRLRYQTFIDAPPGVAPADLPVEVRVLGGDRAALTMPHGRPAPVSDADPRRLAFSGDFGLEQLPAGRYVLQISAADPRTKAGVVREVSFVVE